MRQNELHESLDERLEAVREAIDDAEGRLWRFGREKVRLEHLLDTIQQDLYDAEMEYEQAQKDLAKAESLFWDIEAEMEEAQEKEAAR